MSKGDVRYDNFSFSGGKDAGAAAAMELNLTDLSDGDGMKERSK
jgi:hypothetical protein